CFEVKSLPCDSRLFSFIWIEFIILWQRCGARCKVSTAKSARLDHVYRREAEHFHNSAHLVILRHARKKRNAKEKFCQYATKRPHVDRHVVSGAKYNLWCA